MPPLLALVESRLSDQGITRIWAAIMGVNLSSQRSFKKAGFKVHETSYFFSVPFTAREFLLTRRK